jgi:hypothetical protein
VERDWSGRHNFSGSSLSLSQQLRIPKWQMNS